MKRRILAALAATAAALGLSGCVTDDYGYGRVGVGYGSGYYSGPYYGWYDDFYYPGTGYYIYDRGGHRHRWNDSHRRYWQARRGNHRGGANWSGYPHRQQSRNWTPEQREAWRARRSQSERWTPEQREAWRAQRQEQGSVGNGERRRGGNWWRNRRN